MKISQTENELVIRETPGSLWLFGLFFAVIGAVFVYGSLGGFTNAEEVPQSAIYLTFFMGAIAVGAGIWIIYQAPVSKIVVSRVAETVVYIRYGLSGRRESRFGFGEIRKFSLVEEKDSEDDPIWSLGMELANGQTIKISSLASHDEKFKRDFVFRINEFMRKQIPSTQMILEIEDESVEEIS